MRKKIIDKIVEDMRDGLECPTPQIIDGKKYFILNGDFITLDAEPVHGQRAFIVNGENKNKSYWVEVTEVNL